MHEKQRSFGLNATFRAALAGLLAVLLLLATTLSVSHALHKSLHLQDGTSTHFCLVCSLVKGQVSTAEVGLVSGPLLLCILSISRLATVSPVEEFEYSPSQSRAPPRW